MTNRKFMSLRLSYASVSVKPNFEVWGGEDTERAIVSPIASWNPKYMTKSTSKKFWTLKEKKIRTFFSPSQWCPPLLILEKKIIQKNVEMTSHWWFLSFLKFIRHTRIGAFSKSGRLVFVLDVIVNVTHFVMNYHEILVRDSRAHLDPAIVFFVAKP